jgi:hypothetical protein
MLDQGYIAPGDRIVDPFGGIAGFGYHAMLHGLHFTGVELEDRFVALGNANIDKWRRDLAMLNGSLGTARLVQGDSRRLAEIVGAAGGVVSSPQFGESLESKDDLFNAVARPGRTIQIADYGSTPGQLGSMRSGDFGAAVSSPPYAANEKSDYLLSDDGKTRRRDVKRGFKQGYGCFRGSETYGNSDGQLGREREDTFWSAARVILEQTYAVLRPGGYAAWVTKRFVRSGAIVEFSDQWEQLCAACGFEPVERIHAMLVEEHGEQLDIFGNGHKKSIKRASFFRRLYESKYPHNSIDWEDVIILRKPL